MEERKSPKEGTIRGVVPMFCSVGAKMGRGLSVSEELGGLSAGGISVAIVYNFGGSKRTKHILPLGLGVVLSEAIPHGGINPMCKGQAAAELFPWFALVRTTLGVSELISASI